MKLTRTAKSGEKNVYNLLSEKSENVFHKETKPFASKGGGIRVCVHSLLPRTNQGVNECDGE